MPLFRFSKFPGRKDPPALTAAREFLPFPFSLLFLQRPGLCPGAFFSPAALPLSLMRAGYSVSLRRNLEINWILHYFCEQSVIYIPARRV
jgi:hypothetical protein